jgi:UDP-N-acetyl-D-glucosamine dehydrogenase
MDQLMSGIETQRATIGVIGLGYVGLPLAERAARVGFTVLGFDVLAERVAAINRGESYIADVPSDALAAQVSAGRLSATDRMARLVECDVTVICVPTPLNATREPDMRFIEAAADAVAAVIRPGQLIILESTTYPGTTREVLLPRFNARGLTLGHDFFLAFSPERIDPGATGSAGFSVENTPKVVGGMTDACTALAGGFYRHITSSVVPVSSPDAAELTKLFENIFRAVNIALVNELALLCDRMNLNVWEVIAAAATKPYGFMKFTPGPGLGGHCIPIDPFYLTWKARAYDLTTRFIELAGEINTQMPRHVIELVFRALNRRRKALNGSTVLVLGVAYKPDVDDYRESPAFKVIDLLEAEGAEVIAVDPYIDEFISHDGRRRRTAALDDALLQRADCAVIITNHRRFDYQRIVECSDLVVDTRNATAAVSGDLRSRIELL